MPIPRIEPSREVPSIATRSTPWEPIVRVEEDEREHSAPGPGGRGRIRGSRCSPRGRNPTTGPPSETRSAAKARGGEDRMRGLTPIAERAGPGEKLGARVRWLARRGSASSGSGVRSKVSSIEESLHELVRAISSGRHFVAVGSLPRWSGRRSFDTSMRGRGEQRGAAPWGSGSGSSRGRGIRYCRSGRLFWICAETPFTAPHGAIVRDARRGRIRLGEYWIETRREGGRWLTRARIDPVSARRLGINAIC